MESIETDLDDRAEARVDDYWLEGSTPSLSSQWKGRTLVYLLRPRPSAGYRWIEGRLTKIQETTRPDSVWPENWHRMSAKQKKIKIDKWATECVKSQATCTIKARYA